MLDFSVLLHFLLSLNAFDGISAITSSFSAMIFGVRDDAFISSCCSTRRRISLSPGNDVEVLSL